MDRQPPRGPILQQAVGAEAKIVVDRPIHLLWLRGSCGKADVERVPIVIGPSNRQGVAEIHGHHPAGDRVQPAVIQWANGQGQIYFGRAPQGYPRVFGVPRRCHVDKDIRPNGPARILPTKAASGLPHRLRN